MQEQAAPERFHGPYPHCLTIPIKYIPKDGFLQKVLKNAEKQYAKLEYNGELEEHIQNFQDQFKTGNIVDKDELDQMSVLKKINNNTAYQGYFPRLVLDITDPELQQVIDEKCEGDFDKLDLKDIKCTCSQKPAYEEIFDQSISNRVGERDAIMYNSCKRCVLAAAKRQMKAAPTPDNKTANDFYNYAVRKIDEYLGDQLNNFGYSFGQWYNHLSADKQLQMDNVVKELQMHDEGIDLDGIKNGDVELHRILDASTKAIQRLSHYEAICKAELQGPDGKPRMVCKIPMITKFVMGPITWKLEDLCTKLVPCYCGGMNLQQMAEKINHYIDLGFTQVAQGDGSAFDNTQDIKLKNIDRYIYNKIPDHAIHHVHPDLFRMVSNQYYKIMDVLHRNPITKRIEKLLSYAVLGTVFSGDCDTTLMNTLRMGLYNMYTNEKAGLKFGEDFICFSKGDDFTVMYKNYITLEQVESIYKARWLRKPSKNAANVADYRIFGLGQILKFIDLGPPKIFEFCSLKAFYIDHKDHIYLTRNPEKLTELGRYSRKIKNRDDYGAAIYMLEQAISLEASYSQIKYMMDVAQQYRLKAEWYLKRSKITANISRKRRKYVQRLLYKKKINIDHLQDIRDEENLLYSDYWESVKAIYNSNPTVLSPEQARYVNEQFDEMNLPKPSEVLMPW